MATRRDGAALRQLQALFSVGAFGAPVAESTVRLQNADFGHAFCSINLLAYRRFVIAASKREGAKLCQQPQPIRPTLRMN